MSLDRTLDKLIAEIGSAAWFAACGAPLTQGERREAQLYAGALGFADVPVAAVAGWRAAAEITQRADWSRAWWDQESAAESALKRAAAAAHGEEAMLEALSRVALAAAALGGAAAQSLARGGLADEALMRVAAGAAAQACHQAALARAAAAGDEHGFALKFRLFAGGRWPLGIVGAALFVF